MLLIYKYMWRYLSFWVFCVFGRMWNSIIERRHERTCLRDLRPGKPQTGLRSYRLAIVLKFWIWKLELLHYLSSEQQRCWSDCAEAQADLHLCCSHTAKTGVARLYCFLIVAFSSTAVLKIRHIYIVDFSIIKFIRPLWRDFENQSKMNAKFHINSI